MTSLFSKYITKPLTISIILFAAYSPLSSQADTQSSTSSDTEINYSSYKANGNQLLLWFYSEAGPQDSETKLAKELATLGVEVWLIDLFDSYFLPISLSSMDKIPAADISQFIEQAAINTGKQVTAITSGRSAIPLLRAVRHTQINNTKSKALTGIILVSPKFYTGTPAPGQDGLLMPIVSNSNALLFVIQPAKSPWFWKLDKTIPALEKSGSDVYLHIIKGVRDRFYFRSDADQTENSTTSKFPAIIKKALSALANYPKQARYASQSSLIEPKAKSTKKERTLKKHTGNTTPPKLDLYTIESKKINLKDLKNKVVLVNFWATWCPPCVHEMPSMQRLQDKFDRDKFVILGVNMAEEKATIQSFVKNRVAVDFPILMDSNGAALKRWQVFAFPTSYLIDKSGNIRYSLFGSIEWDTNKITSIINELIDE